MVAQRHLHPAVEIVGFSQVVHGVSRPAVEQHESAPDGGHAHWREEPIEQQDGNGQNVPLATVSDDRTG